jgi:hypothetical protein
MIETGWMIVEYSIERIKQVVTTIAIKYALTAVYLDIDILIDY